MSDELAGMIESFVEDSHEAFESIESDLLSFESDPNDLSKINGIFRVMHTIKGTAGFLGLEEVSSLAHSLESIFDNIRKETLQVSADLMDSLLPASDLLKQMVFELVHENKSDYPLQETIDTLTLLASGDAEEKPAETVQPEPAVEEASASSVEEGGLEISKEILNDFVVETEDHLVAIEEQLLTLEKTPDNKDSIDELFRAIHSIKGNAAYVRLDKINRLSHKMETVFERIRKGTYQYNAELSDVFLKSLDLLRTLVFMVKMGDDDSIISVDEMLAGLDKFIEAPEAGAKKEATGVKSEKPSSSSGKINSAFENVRSQHSIVIEAIGAEMIDGKADDANLQLFHRSVQTIRGAASKCELHLLVNESAKLEELLVSLLAREVQYDDVSSKLTKAINRYIKLLENPELEQAEEADTKPQSAPVAKKQEEQQRDAGDNEIKTMRVDAGRLDLFMNLIGELIITRNSFNHVSGVLETEDVPGSILQKLKNVESSLNRISDDLQNTLMEMRLVQVKTVFQKIPRIVRDIARKTNKKIQIQMVGEHTEIDKSIVELIGDPLIHIIRNSCDHGIESVEERLAAGKPESGTIILKASHMGGAIEIDVIDDGKGINTDRVLQKAIENGLVDPADADKLDAKTINNFIFKPGFSTAEEVTDISGRGVGMDVVLTNIQRIHGTVDVESEPGQGSKVRMTLPLTLAVVEALIVSAGSQKFAVPLDSVNETLEIRAGELQHLKQKEAIDLRGNIIGVSRLSDILNLGEYELNPDQVVSIVFLQMGSRQIGVVVDDLHTQQEIVVKPLQGYLTKIPGIKGSTILGNGEVILILEPTELIELSAL